MNGGTTGGMAGGAAGICQDRVVIVTGAGRGIGREHALEFARQGADVVVNDLGAAVDGTGASLAPAVEVAAEIRALGRRAVVNGDDVADEQGARNLIATAVHELGRLDVLVNNAGILRDRMLVNMSFEEWDAVMRVHLRGTFGPTHFAAQHWRERSKAGDDVDARVINTSSPSGLYGNVGQSNYGAAKAGIAAFTIIAARELQRYGVTVNAIAPAAATRMTIPLMQARQAAGASGTGGGGGTGGSGEAPGVAGRPPGAFDPAAPDNIAPIVVWLGSPGAAKVTGQVFNVRGGRISLAEGWRRGPAITRDGRWDPAELDELVPALLSEAAAGAAASPTATPATPPTGTPATGTPTTEDR